MLKAANTLETSEYTLANMRLHRRLGTSNEMQTTSHQEKETANR